jgi:hypothetical protein
MTTTTTRRRTCARDSSPPTAPTAPTAMVTKAVVMDPVPFDASAVGPGQVVAIVGHRRSGATVLARDLVYGVRRRVGRLVLFSATERFTREYDDVLSHDGRGAELHERCTEERLGAAMKAGGGPPGAVVVVEDGVAHARASREVVRKAIGEAAGRGGPLVVCVDAMYPDGCVAPGDVDCLCLFPPAARGSRAAAAHEMERFRRAFGLATQGLARPPGFDALVDDLPRHACIVVDTRTCAWFVHTAAVRPAFALTAQPIQPLQSSPPPEPSQPSQPPPPPEPSRVLARVSDEIQPCEPEPEPEPAPAPASAPASARSDEPESRPEPVAAPSPAAKRSWWAYLSRRR